MSSTTKCLMPTAAVVLCLAAVLVLLALAGNGQDSSASSLTPRQCFLASKWGPAPDAVRPCVEVTRIFEDGSFSYRVSDADGTVRYSAGVGALDR